MVDDVVINGLNKDEIYPELFDLISDVKSKFGINKKINVHIIDDLPSGPNLWAEHKHHSILKKELTPTLFIW